MSKKYISYNSDRSIRCEIEEDCNVGFYLVAYKKNSKRSFADHLLDSFEDAIDQAESDYGIAPKAWGSVEERN